MANEQQITIVRHHSVNTVYHLGLSEWHAQALNYALDYMVDMEKVAPSFVEPLTAIRDLLKERVMNVTKVQTKSTDIGAEWKDA